MAGMTISFSSDRFDQWRLTQAGGYIAFKKGKPVFQFDSFDQYQTYMALNALNAERTQSGQGSDLNRVGKRV